MKACDDDDGGSGIGQVNWTKVLIGWSNDAVPNSYSDEVLTIRTTIKRLGRLVGENLLPLESKWNRERKKDREREIKSVN